MRKYNANNNTKLKMQKKKIKDRLLSIAVLSEVLVPETD